MKKINAEVEYETCKCEKHGDYKAKVFYLLGKKNSSKCPSCLEESNQKEKEQNIKIISAEKKLKIKNLFHDSLIPLRFKSKDFNGYTAENNENKLALTICEKYANNFITRHQAGGGIVMCGKPGTGKTHLAAAISNKVIADYGMSVLFISVMQALRRVKETYSRDSEKKESEVIRAFNTPDLLIIDEIGVQFGSDTEKMILFEIINNRYQNVLPTILISNLSLDELNDYIGERVVDRMREGGGAVISFDWESYRGK